LTINAMSERPTGTVTFLFTDIEGSTGRWEAQTAEMQAALARHDETLRAAVETHGGWLFKHTGDGILAAFASPGAAVEAAIEAQRGLELPVRMGLATGEAELRGDDYFGPTLNRASRVKDAGHGGQILLASTTAELVDGVDLLELGEHRLRDLSRSQRLFQLRAEGLRERFPELRTIDTTPGNLGVQATSFIGREAELAEVEAAVRERRLVTLTGVGGVGKTRLALQVAAELAPEFPDGVWLIELAPVGDPESIPDAVAGTLGITQQPGLTVAQSIAEASVGRARLLVLDNCEHVLEAAAGLVELVLSRAPTVRILATSREGLGVPGEHLWPLPSLDAAGRESEAVTLFIDRARAVAPAFTLARQADIEAVLDICQRLDGIPLAIELAAARMVSMSPADVAVRLRDRFRLLSGSRRGVERHQTLRNAVQWSYDLLDEHERTLLDRCSVFAGGFGVEAAVAIAGGGELDDYAVLDLLDSLVRKSLLTVERGEDGHARYGMLETIRRFADERLGLAGLAAEVRDRHGRYYSQAAQEAESHLEEREQVTWLDRLQDDEGNLRVALRHLEEEGAWEEGCRMATSLTQYWLTRGDVSEGRRWIEAFLRGSGVAVPEGERASALNAAGLLARYQGEYGVAEYLITEALSMHRARGDDRRVADSLANLGYVVLHQARWSEARECYSESLARAEQAGNDQGVADALHHLGLVAFQEGDLPAAETYRRKALEIWRRLGDLHGVVDARVNLGQVALAGGHLRHAREHLLESLDGAQALGSGRLQAEALEGTAHLLARLSWQEAAVQLVGAAAALREGTSTPKPSVGEDDRDRDLTILQEALGQAEFERLTAKGAAMELPEAVAFAREQLALVREALDEAGP
jgi:predicted ATPase/class 3 adenylate cyclase